MASTRRPATARQVISLDEGQSAPAAGPYALGETSQQSGPPGPGPNPGPTPYAGVGFALGFDSGGGGDGAIIPGPPGAAGSAGPVGAAGPPGLGVPGMDGDEGPMGMPIPGAVGPPGSAGATGATGPQGPIGFGLDGDEGQEGFTIPGAPGPTGPPGALGPQGSVGIPGSEGDEGPMGLPIPGPIGPTGPTGATGPPGGALVILEQYTFSGISSQAFTSWYSTTYDQYRMEFINIIASGTASTLNIQVSSNGGSTYDTASHYTYSYNSFSTGGSGIGGSASATTSLQLYPGINGRTLSNTANQSISGTITFYNPANAAVYTPFNDGTFLGPDSVNTTGNAQRTEIVGYYVGLSAWNALKVFVTGITISGTIRIYGIAH